MHEYANSVLHPNLLACILILETQLKGALSVFCKTGHMHVVGGLDNALKLAANESACWAAVCEPDTTLRKNKLLSVRMYGHAGSF